MEFYFIKVFKILINEHSALAPPALLDFINYYFEQHSRFHYNQFIQLNYKANLNMIRRQMALEGISTGQSGGSGSQNRDGGNIGSGTGGIQAGNVGGGTGANGPVAGVIAGIGSAGGSVFSKSLNRSFQDMFESINYHSDVYYLKFINALRLNNYTAAQESFYTYFDLKKWSSRFGSSISSTGAGAGAGTNAQPITNGQQVNGIGGGGVGGAGGSVSSSSVSGATNSVNGGVGGTFGGANFCWSSLNLAIMYAHFHHYRLAYEALTDCISAAREKRDERCLQYAMIWLLHVLQQFRNYTSNGDNNINNNDSMMVTSYNCSSSSNNSITNQKQQNRSAELSHRYNRAYHDLNLIQNLINLISINEYSLPYIAAMAYLHLEKQIYLRANNTSIITRDPLLSSYDTNQLLHRSHQTGARRPPLTTKPLIMATRHQMDDILLRTYALHAAVLNAYGAVHLAAAVSNILARLDLVDTLDQEQVAHVNENQAIACRNDAFYHWHIKGNYQQAIEQLSSFGKYYSTYNSPIRMIIEQAKAEIRFDKFVYSCDWSNAIKCINLVSFLSVIYEYFQIFNN